MTVQITEFTDDLPQTDDFKSIVLNQTPLIDVRAPVEYVQGAFISSTNLPLMNDDERQKVGLCYKQNGNAAAVALGHQLVNQQTREPRVESWIEFMDANPTALLYCFRGGMRSKISQQWLQDAGREIVRLKGGYKAFRRYLIDFIDSVPSEFEKAGIEPVVLAGRTGSGKTLVIHQLNNAIDLEGLAHHRGSAFGRHATPQPTQINFENNLAMDLIRFMETQPKHLVIEDEGRNIGSVNLSKELFEFLKSGSRVVVDTSIEERVAITLDEYVIEAQAEYNNIAEWEDFMRGAMQRIQKRLGGERYQRVMSQFDFAMKTQLNQNTIEEHQAWIKTLLVEYYDPMYDYQMQKNNKSVIFKGSISEVVDYLNNLDA
ncbi:tRNA 2-selenouridine(34) synthase MnmH [Thiomicrorhabdus sp. Milos-T2]|uniref:tRNA 2-selenouridine(34) synthase MnmH n=1 Tax=Thiomicrorhabdus sp. Milos-T2 TaxID=90814 RepID=UPI0004940890|nr:tRNA 2-selenouridine(34) synthase MnmH [Thiomicrorhabdus sp. Milos-T2]